MRGGGGGREEVGEQSGDKRMQDNFDPVYFLFVCLFVVAVGFAFFLCSLDKSKCIDSFLLARQQIFLIVVVIKPSNKEKGIRSELD